MAEEDWMQKKWRPAMGWTYMIICLLDMAVFPIIWSLAQMLTKQPISQWMPLTLQGAGLFHIAMGAVLGIAAFGRTQEKVAGAASNTEPPKAPSFPVGMSTTSSVPAPTFSAPLIPITTAASIPAAPIKKPQQEEPPTL